MRKISQPCKASFNEFSQIEIINLNILWIKNWKYLNNSSKFRNS